MYRLSQQLFPFLDEPERVRELHVQIERRFVHESGVHREADGVAQSFERVNVQTSFLFPSALDDPKQLLAERGGIFRRRREADDEVKRQAQLSAGAAYARCNPSMSIFFI